MFSVKTCDRAPLSRVLTCVHKSFMGWNSILLNGIKNEKEKSSSEISHLLCCLKKTEGKKGGERRRVGKTKARNSVGFQTEGWRTKKSKEEPTGKESNVCPELLKSRMRPACWAGRYHGYAPTSASVLQINM